MKNAWLTLTALLLSTTLQAETFYVTDSFRVPLRSGNTNGYRIVAELKTGTSVKLLEADKASGYSKVITKKGTEGWMLTRYLVSQPIAKVRLETAEAKLKELSEQRNALKGSQSELEQTAEKLQQDNQALKEFNTKISDELAYIKQVSGNTVAINQRNQELVEENQQLQNQIELMTAQIDRLKDDTNKEYFLYGAGAILIGIFLGLTIPSIRRKRKDPGWV